MVTYITRAQWGARPPTNSTSLVVSEVDNTAVHWPGTSSKIDATGDIGFRRICSALRGWQNYHMDSRGWSDIAYCIAVDQAGRAYTLRGINNRSGANGDGPTNRKYGAILVILAPGEKPSAAMKATMREVMVDYRKRFSRIPKRPTWHGAVRPGGTASDPSTTCPGKDAIAAIKAGEFDAGTVSTPSKPTTPTAPPPLTDWEQFMALFNSVEEYIEATAKGVERGAARYAARFLKDEEGSGDTILDDVKAHREAELGLLEKIADNTNPSLP